MRAWEDMEFTSALNGAREADGLGAAAAEDGAEETHYHVVVGHRRVAQNLRNVPHITT